MSLTEPERLATLRRVSFFTRLDDSDLQHVNRYAYLQSFEAGQQIFHQGDPGNCLYIIVSGHVRIYLGSPGGKLVTLRIYSPGDVFGEFAVLDGEPRSAHAVAMIPVVALAIDRDQFQALRQAYPTISDGVITALVERLRTTTTFGQNMAFLGAVGKIATALAQLGQSLGDGKMPVRLKYSQSEIGLMAGVTREWVNKAYKELFVPNELIKLDQKRDEVVILDLERLAQWEELPDGPRRMDADGACAYARQRLEMLPRSLLYHSLGHTRDDVVPTAEQLAKQLGYKQRDRQLLMTAAWFHDLGFLETRRDHEEASIQIAISELPRYGFAKNDIAKICGMIRATRIPQQPTNELEQILVDADMVSLGRADFLKQSMALYEELTMAGQTISLGEWVRRQRTLLMEHQFFTTAARQHGDDQKARNLAKLEQLIAAGQP